MIDLHSYAIEPTHLVSFLLFVFFFNGYATIAPSIKCPTKGMGIVMMAIKDENY